MYTSISVCSKKFRKCYTIISKITNWNQARLECWTRNMSQVTMLSLSEMRFIKYLLRERRKVDVPPTTYFDAEYYVHIGLKISYLILDLKYHVTFSPFFQGLRSLGKQFALSFSLKVRGQTRLIIAFLAALTEARFKGYMM